jgi:hypothetical protein
MTGADEAELRTKGALLRHRTNFRVAMLLKRSTEQKTGLVSSQSGSGRALQSVASFVTPGDMSKLRNPVRSAAVGAVTPGGGGGLGPRIGGGGGLGAASAAARILRCPTGFANGGQYTTRGYANCGRQLFETPGPVDDVGPKKLGAGKGPDFGLVGLLDTEGRRVVGASANDLRAVQIQRNAQIPRVAAARNGDRLNAVDNAVQRVAADAEKSSLMVRRDGVTLKPSVTPDILGNVRNNPDMNGATFITNAPDPSKMAEGEVPLLWKANALSTVVALPGNNTITMTRTRDLTAADKRRLTRSWAKQPEQAEFEFGARLRNLANSSGGALAYTEKLSVDNPNEMVRIGDGKGQQRNVRRWVYDTYLASTAPARNKRSPWDELSSTSSSTDSTDFSLSNVAEATALLREGGPIESVPSKFLDAALTRSMAFRRTKVRDGVEALDRPDGTRYYRTEPTKDLGAVAARVGTDVRSTLGLPPVTAKFAGDGPQRSLIFSAPGNIGGARVNRAKPLDQISAEQLLRLSVADWLTDHVDRSPGTITPLDSGSKTLAYVTPDVHRAVLTLAEKRRLADRRQLKLGNFYQPDNIYERSLSKVSPRQQQGLPAILDDIIKQAAEFDWAEYRTRLELDGALSSQEKSHVTMMQAIYEDRLTMLRAAKQAYLRTVGIRLQLGQSR